MTDIPKAKDTKVDSLTLETTTHTSAYTILFNGLQKNPTTIYSAACQLIFHQNHNFLQLFFNYPNLLTWYWICYDNINPLKLRNFAKNRAINILDIFEKVREALRKNGAQIRQGLTYFLQTHCWSRYQERHQCFRMSHSYEWNYFLARFPATSILSNIQNIPMTIPTIFSVSKHRSITINNEKFPSSTGSPKHQQMPKKEIINDL